MTQALRVIFEEIKQRLERGTRELVHAECKAQQASDHSDAVKITVEGLKQVALLIERELSDKGLER